MSSTLKIQNKRNYEFVDLIEQRMLIIYPPALYYLEYAFNCDEVRCFVYFRNYPNYPELKLVARMVFNKEKYIAPYFYFFVFKFLHFWREFFRI
jgi:hypothetical protein